MLSLRGLPFPCADWAAWWCAHPWHEERRWSRPGFPLRGRRELVETTLKCGDPFASYAWGGRATSREVGMSGHLGAFLPFFLHRPTPCTTACQYLTESVCGQTFVHACKLVMP